MKQRVLFHRVAATGAAGGTGMLVAPSFGRCCVCCNADAMGRTQDPDPSPGYVRLTPVELPVCIECKDHAVQRASAPRLQALMVTLGLMLFAVGAYYLTRRPHDLFLWGLLAVSGMSFGAGVVWIRATSRRNRREQIAGHHPRLELAVFQGRTLLDTTNEELVRELLARNPNARLLPEPLLWRWQRRWQLPAARVVRAREP